MSKRDCVERYNKDSSILRTKLARLNQIKPIPNPPTQNDDEIKYKNRDYVGSFTKPLNHDLITGHLINPEDFEKMRDSIAKVDQIALSQVPLHPNSSIKLANPLASKATVLIGAPLAALKYASPDPPTLSSKAMAAEMIELYSKLLARDIPFSEFGTDLTITTLLGYMNDLQVRQNLKGSLANINTPFTAKTIFRGNMYGEQYGPLISQFFFNKITMGAMVENQKYLVPKPRTQAVSRVEWGVDNVEMINMQNGVLANLPPATQPADLVSKFIYSGRSLAEVVHNDPPFHFFYLAAMLLSTKKCPVNVEFPNYPNQGNFTTNSGLSAALSSIADVCNLALKNAWYIKWCWSRKIRPEATGLWVDNVKNNRVSNAVYEIDSLLLNHPVLTDVKNLHSSVYSKVNSYNLNQCYREGAPTHPAYPSGHAAIAGACVTLIKIYFDCEVPWKSLFDDVIEADSTGTNTQSYSGLDANNMTISTELNKLASNVALGRNWAGVHYRSDGIRGILLGEQVATHYMRDILAANVENNMDGSAPQVVFRKFDGTYETISPTTCV